MSQSGDREYGYNKLSEIWKQNMSDMNDFI